ncbi:MAG: hypothetical protein VXY76_07585, partial [Pseudomonadota bacterium]|nr:hypothetical protein [Pseudomonadota bacterium]
MVTLLAISGALVWLDSSGRRLVQSGSVDRLDGTANVLWQIRGSALSLASPVYLIAKAPYALYGLVSDISSDRQSLLQQR